VKLQSALYNMVGGVLYRKGYTLPLLKCLSAAEANYVLREIYEGVCENHLGGRQGLLLAHNGKGFGRAC